MRKMMRATGFLAVFLVAMTGVGAQVGTIVEATAWMETDLSESTPSVTFSDDAGQATVQFYSKGTGVPPQIAAGLGADATISAGVVVGNYENVEGLSFVVIRSGGMMAEVSVQLRGTTGAIWTHRATAQLSGTAGEACAVNVPTDPAMWEYGGRLANSSARWTRWWNQDIADVTNVSLVIAHVGFNPETVSVSNFRLVGEGFIGDAATLALVKEHFAADISNSDELTAEQRAQDSDRNGRSDLTQILAGEDAGLYVEIVAVEEDGRARLRWSGAVPGRRYRVERTQDLTALDGFENVPIDNPVANQVGHMERTDRSEVVGDGAYFYRAVKE